MAAEASTEAVDDAMQALFRAYDIDESGEITRDEFLGIEMRLDFEEGNEFRTTGASAKMTLTDRDSSGTLDYEEFRTRFLLAFQEMNLPSSEIVRRLNDKARRVLLERARMGPRSHAGIRHALRRIFALFDVSGDGNLQPEEWIAAQKTVAIEVSEDLDEGWIAEGAFAEADTDGDGSLDLGEFLEASFSMFEGITKHSDDILAILERMVTAMEEEQLSGRRETQPITIMVQTKATPAFLPPQAAWQDEASVDDPHRGADMWQEGGAMALPLNLATVEDVSSLLRIILKKPSDTWLSIFFLGAPREGVRPVVRLRGDRPGEGNVQAMLQYLCKPHADHRLFVKNVRKRPQKLTRQPRAFLEERDRLLTFRSGRSWGLDWETQLVGDGQVLPPRPLVIAAGDALVVEVPIECGAPLDRYVCSIYMDRTDTLGKPVDENIVPKAKKKARSKRATPEPDPLLQLIFVALKAVLKRRTTCHGKEGTCVLFVDVSWEDQEEKLALEHRLRGPVNENSVARIGPIEVKVEGAAGRPDNGAETALVWWNGEKWSKQKGPAKRKGKKR